MKAKYTIGDILRIKFKDDEEGFSEVIVISIKYSEGDIGHDLSDDSYLLENSPRYLVKKIGKVKNIIMFKSKKETRSAEQGWD